MKNVRHFPPGKSLRIGPTMCFGWEIASWSSLRRRSTMSFHPPSSMSACSKYICIYIFIYIYIFFFNERKVIFFYHLILY